MPNKTQNATSLQGNGEATLSHATAAISTCLIIELKGTKEETLDKLQSIMHVQVSYLIKCIELGTASEDEFIDAAISTYLEAQCKYHYLSNNLF